MREFEGMSYREIGERLGMSRPAVESTLFRARRRLTEEYDDLVSGARCQRIQTLIVAAGETRLGTRESRRLSRHVAHCQPCRREAMAAGLDSAILTHVPLRKRAAEKIAALLPFGWFGRGRGGDADGDDEQLGRARPDALRPAAGRLGQAGHGGGRAGGRSRRRGRRHQGHRLGRSAARRRRSPGRDRAQRRPREGRRSVDRHPRPRHARDGGLAEDGEEVAQGRSRGQARPGQRGAGGGDGGTPSVGLASAAAAVPPRAAAMRPAAPSRACRSSSSRSEATIPIAPVQETVEDVVEAVPPVVNGVTDTVEQTAGTLEDTVEDVGEAAGGATDGILP